MTGLLLAGIDGLSLCIAKGVFIPAEIAKVSPLIVQCHNIHRVSKFSG